MKKPVDAIERLNQYCAGESHGRGFTCDLKAILAYLDSTPEWPADLTRERLKELVAGSAYSHAADALRRLAQIAPKREQRKVALWKDEAHGGDIIALPLDRIPNIDKAGWWRRVGECEVDA